MGLFLLLILSLFFGWCFSEHKNRKLDQLQSALDHEKDIRKRESENHEIIVKRLQNTIREILREV